MSSLKHIPVYEGEFWTARQRQMHSLHYIISYRGSFKPELPNYFISHYSNPGAIIADPFCGRGTTILQANLLGRTAWANDVNPLAVYITRAKVNPVKLQEIESFLNRVDWYDSNDEDVSEDLLAFYHFDTVRELCALKKFLAQQPDETGRFVELLALSRLHGHSSGFFSTYSMPQLSVPAQAQRRINRLRGQEPEYRAVSPRILAKASTVLRDNISDAMRAAGISNRYSTLDSRNLSTWPSGQVELIVTSPPFLNKVNYIEHNWLELWFTGIDPSSLQDKLIQTSCLEEWRQFMAEVLLELGRILQTGGICVIEVGDICYRGVRINLDEIVAELALNMQRQSRLALRQILVHRQNFSKLAHCFNVTNNSKGTNTQRLLIMEKI